MDPRRLPLSTAPVEDRTNQLPMSEEEVLQRKFTAQQQPFMGGQSPYPPARPPYSKLQNDAGASDITGETLIGPVASTQLLDPAYRLSETADPKQRGGINGVDMTQEQRDAQTMLTQIEGLRRRGLISPARYQQLMQMMGRQR